MKIIVVLLLLGVVALMYTGTPSDRHYICDEAVVVNPELFLGLPINLDLRCKRWHEVKP